MKLTLYARVGTDRERVKQQQNGKYIEVQGASCYQYRQGTKWITLDKNFDKAVLYFADIVHAEELRANGHQVAVTQPKTETDPTISDAIQAYLYEHRFGRPRSIKAYECAFDQLLKYAPRSLQTIKQLGTTAALNAYVDHLVRAGFAPKTVAIRMGHIFSLLKANGVANSSKLVKLRKVVPSKPKAYNAEDLQKLFAAMDAEEYVRYLFFLSTGCREQEVSYATWRDIDFRNLRYTVTGEGKVDVNFVPKSHQERWTPISTDLAKLLKARKHVSERWIFPNTENRPEGHFLREFKEIALRAGLNCGECVKKEGECSTDPVCEEHYLHRLRKTAATNWLKAGSDLRWIQNRLGHKSLEVTQIYLDGEQDDPEQQGRVDRAMNWKAKPQLMRAIGD